MSATLITLITDFGVEDAYVAQMKGQILSICSAACLIDITHAIPAQDVMRAALVLSQAAPYFPAESIHLVSVDPGVGTERRMLALEIETTLDSVTDACIQRFVLPDNGLIGPLARRYGILAANALTESKYWRSRISATFHGRDIMGPVAAHWAAGVERDQFGPSASDVQLIHWPEPEVLGGAAYGEVIAVDHFGNVITNLPGSWLVGLGNDRNSRAACDVEIGGKLLRMQLTTTYGEQALGDAVVIVGSHELVELAVVGGNAARQLGLAVGERLRIRLDKDVLPREQPG
jgi:S-adenosylmethionine hydrolase